MSQLIEDNRIEYAEKALNEIDLNGLIARDPAIADGFAQMLFASSHQVPISEQLYESGLSLLNARLPAKTVEKIVTRLPVIAAGHVARIENGSFVIPGPASQADLH